MTANPNQITRRDWFRLRVPHSNQVLDEPNLEAQVEKGVSSAVPLDDSPVSTLSSKNDNGLKPIPHPENHVGLDLSQLPPMREAELSPEQVGVLFDDIEKLATDIHLMQRPGGSMKASSQSLVATQMGAARGWLLQGEIKRIQIRYRWQDAFWIDTLESRESGFRLVRIQHSNKSV